MFYLFMHSAMQKWFMSRMLQYDLSGHVDAVQVFASIFASVQSNML